ncbi:hypothetical protein HW115_11720 [Verrucomicrobiaceae bacterium N1E253]|uniref:Peptidase M56 domain-containing protein n=1 Tax=Oceaniferula marina TaxID=2748318 RepID=A0A851GK99_9BACT|nr:M56 family metallopeptidase [Oceaniferula marina]NWK56281.1 hypothetical protein [Oceaniferula marina]
MKASLALPAVLLAVFVSRRTSSSVVGLLLLCVLVSLPLTPFLDGLPLHVKITMPWLEASGAFPDEIEALAEYDKNNPLPVPASEIVLGKESGWTRKQVFLGLWGLGAVAFLVVRLWSSMNSRLRFSSSTPASSDDVVVHDFRELCESLSLKRVPWLLYNQLIKGPQTTGILRPAILLPSHFPDLPREHRDMILLHELEHIRRRDIPWRMVLELLAIVFWFNPLVWLALRAYDLQVEKSCDDTVLRAGYPASKYGEVLLASVRGGVPGGAAGVVSKVASPAQLRARMFSIVQKEKSRLPLTQASTRKFAGLFLLLIVPLGLVSFSPYSGALSYELVEKTEGLDALWRMRLGRGTILADSSGGEHHGKLYGAQWTRDPERGECLYFDGVEDHLMLRAPQTSWTRKPFTMAVWLKPDKGSDGGGLLLRGDLNQTWCSALGTSHESSLPYGEREIMLAGDRFGEGSFNQADPGMHLAFNYFGVGSARAERPVKELEWTHLAMVWRPAGGSALVQFYLNGESVKTVYVVRAIDLGQNQDWPTKIWYFGLGESPLVVGNNYEGLVSDLAIYQKALLPKDIKRVMRGDFTVKGSF